MANTGIQFDLSDMSYEDLPSLKKFVRSAYNKIYTNDSFNLKYVSHYQTSTGTAAEFESTDSIAIAQIGKTEVTLVLSCATADEASHNTKVFTLVYTDADGESHTAVATGTATLFNTPVAFVPAASDVYCVTSFTASADFDTRDIVAKVAAGATYATITATGTVTAATQAQLLGVGAIYCRAHTNHNDADGAILYGKYFTPWGAEKFCHGTIDTGDSTTEIRFFEAADDGDFTTTATTTTVKDFYRWDWLTCLAAKLPTANCHEYFVTDADCANVDGSGGDVYAIIKEAETNSINTRRHARQGYDSFLVKVKITYQPQVDADDYFITYINCTPDAVGTEIAIPLIGTNKYPTVWDGAMKLKEETDAYFTLYDADVATIAQIEIWTAEVEQI